MKADSLCKPLNIWQVSREMSPFAEAGGIKDVVSGLSRALVKSGHEVTVVLPMYRFLKDYGQYEPLAEFSLHYENGVEVVSLFSHHYQGIRILLVKADCFIGKDRVYTYSQREESENHDFIYGRGHLDSQKMNLTLQYGALEAAIALGEKPHIFHLHDGHCGFLPAILNKVKRYSKFFKGTGTLLTIHNGGVVYQQNLSDSHEAEALTGLPRSVLNKIKTDYGYNPLVCAGLYGHINTVSERYAEDLREGRDGNSGELGEWFRQNHINLIGITNGIDRESHDRCSHFPVLRNGTIESFLEKKGECRSRLIARIGELENKGYLYGQLLNDSRPIITLQSRITNQKGIDVLLECLKVQADMVEAQFLVLGEGDRELEDELASLATQKSNFTYVRHYDPSLSADVFAGGDFFLIPSKWEPCGLTDFIAQLNGNIPIVHETGGLVKTRDHVNGFSYSPNTPDKLGQKIREAVDLYVRDPAILHEIRKNAVNIINEKYTWRKVLDEGYIPLYRSIGKAAKERIH